MLVKLSGGAEIDLATSDELKSHTADALGGIRSHARREKPLFFTRSNSGAGDGTNILMLSLGSPVTGTVWKLDHIVTFGSDDHTTVSGLTGCIYIGSDVNRTLGSLVLPGLTFPDVYDFPQETWVHNHDTVTLVTSGAPSSGQQIGAIIRYREYLEDAVLRSGTC